MAVGALATRVPIMMLSPDRDRLAEADVCHRSYYSRPWLLSYGVSIYTFKCTRLTQGPVIVAYLATRA